MESTSSHVEGLTPHGRRSEIAPRTVEAGRLKPRIDKLQTTIPEFVAIGARQSYITVLLSRTWSNKHVLKQQMTANV